MSQSTKSSKFLNLHTNFQANTTEGIKKPNWEGQEHAKRTKIHTDEQRLEQRARAESPLPLATKRV